MALPNAAFCRLRSGPIVCRPPPCSHSESHSKKPLDSVPPLPSMPAATEAPALSSDIEDLNKNPLAPNRGFPHCPNETAAGKLQPRRKWHLCRHRQLARLAALRAHRSSIAIETCECRITA